MDVDLHWEASLGRERRRRHNVHEQSDEWRWHGSNECKYGRTDFLLAFRIPICLEGVLLSERSDVDTVTARTDRVPAA